MDEPHDANPCPPADAPLENLAAEIYATLAAQFPVCLASDEFHFFPHYRSESPDWSRWDDFSTPALERLDRIMARWLRQLAAFRSHNRHQRIDCDLLTRILTTLQGQLFELRLHARQPTFYLTIVSIGLAEALEAGAQPLAQRVAALPAFLDSAASQLAGIPDVWLQMGQAMNAQVVAWLQGLPVARTTIDKTMDAFQRWQRFLDACESGGPVPVDASRYEKVAVQHMGCRGSLLEIAELLEEEIRITEQLLKRYARQIDPRSHWKEVYARLGQKATATGDVHAAYHGVIDDLRAHCARMGLASHRLLAQCPVSIVEIADHMMAVRSNAAFSMPPGHPPAGGTFYILPRSMAPRLPADYRLLAAHETFPGHHLLDTARWLLKRSLRRPLEFPLFYEGWASFAEEILFDTGFFHGPVDHFLMAHRRFYRALRGRADLCIHTGAASLDEAAAMLTKHGLTAENASAMVRRYSLKPGYQLAYTVGRNRFQALYRASISCEKDIGGFVQKVLASGEIDFESLQTLLGPQGGNA